MRYELYKLLRKKMLLILLSVVYIWLLAALIVPACNTAHLQRI